MTIKKDQQPDRAELEQAALQAAEESRSFDATTPHAISGLILAQLALIKAIREETRAAAATIATAITTAMDAGEDQLDPADPDFMDHVTKTAEALWAADPGKQTPARSFSEDYGAAQDRYIKMARALLAPEPETK